MVTTNSVASLSTHMLFLLCAVHVWVINAGSLVYMYVCMYVCVCMHAVCPQASLQCYACTVHLAVLAIAYFRDLKICQLLHWCWWLWCCVQSHMYSAHRDTVGGITTAIKVHIATDSVEVYGTNVIIVVSWLYQLYSVQLQQTFN